MRRGAFCLFQFFLPPAAQTSRQRRNAPRRILSISMQSENREWPGTIEGRNAPRRILSISIQIVARICNGQTTVVMRRGAFCLFQ